MNTAPQGYRFLTAGERQLAASMFGGALRLDGIRLYRRKWAFFQGREIVMAPRGHIHFHPDSRGWSEDFSACRVEDRAFLLHELVHVWQHQRGIFLPIARHPFCRYRYSITPGWPLTAYGIEQQAEIVRHAFLLREGQEVVGAPALAVYEALLRGFG